MQLPVYLDVGQSGRVSRLMGGLRIMHGRQAVQGGLPLLHDLSVRNRDAAPKRSDRIGPIADCCHLPVKLRADLPRMRRCAGAENTGADLT